MAILRRTAIALLLGIVGCDESSSSSNPTEAAAIDSCGGRSECETVQGVRVYADLQPITEPVEAVEEIPCNDVDDDFLGGDFCLAGC